MSDRREQVARAIYASVSARFLEPKRGAKWEVITDADPVIQTWDTLSVDARNDYLADADAALAVIDAEPTEAEVGVINVQREQARMVIERERHLTFPFTNEDLDDNAEPTEAEIDAAINDFAVKYRRYHNEQERWFDNGRYAESVPRLNRLLDDVNAARGFVFDLIAARKDRP